VSLRFEAFSETEAYSLEAQNKKIQNLNRNISKRTKQQSNVVLDFRKHLGRGLW
jgi:hypothetical protein